MTKMSQEHGPLASVVSSVPARWLWARNGPNEQDTKRMVSTLVLNRRRAICPARFAGQRALPVAAGRELVERAGRLPGVFCAVLLVVLSTSTAGPEPPPRQMGGIHLRVGRRMSGKKWEALGTVTRAVACPPAEQSHVDGSVGRQ